MRYKKNSHLKKNIRTPLLLGCAITMLSGCAENYQKPSAPTPPQWNYQAQDPTIDSRPILSTIDIRTNDRLWWKQFNDPILNKIMDHALTSNLDLKIAQTRLDEAQASATYPTHMPELSLQANMSRQGSQSSTGGTDTPETRRRLGFALNWEIDISGRGRHEDLVREASVELTRAEYDDAYVALLSETAMSYLEVRYLQNLKELTQKNIGLQDETLRVTRLQQEAGAIGSLDTTRAEAQKIRTRAKLPEIETSLTKARYRLSLLMGEAPGSVDKALETTAPIPQVQNALILDAPSKTIAARPDIRAAELRFKIALETKNVSSAELFPTLSLSSFFGLGTSSLYGAATPWSLGLNILEKLVDFGRIQSRIDTAQARQNQAFLKFRQSVLVALEEIETALVSYVNEKQKKKEYTKEAEHRRHAVDLARLQFDAGDVSFLDILNEQERSLEAEASALRADFMITKHMIALYKAMGCSSPSKK